jgi:hypothetical protein
MNSARSDFLHVARERGYIHQTTEEGAFLARLKAGPLAGYIGFDATADSLHVGSLVQIMLLRLMQRTGNRPVVLMGGGTTKVGDPSFRDEARPLLSDAQIETNKAGIRKVFDAFLNFGDGPTDAIMLDNAEWLDKLLYIPFLRDVGRHFSVNRMLTMESVKQRLERDQPLTFLEFNYMLLQAYDFLELRRRHVVRRQNLEFHARRRLDVAIRLGKLRARLVHILDGALGQRAGLLEDDDLLAQDHQRRNRADVEGPGDFLLFFGIDLGEYDVVALLGSRLEGRREAAAGAAPGRPEIDDHHVVAVDGGFKVVLVEFDGSHCRSK